MLVPIMIATQVVLSEAGVRCCVCKESSFGLYCFYKMYVCNSCYGDRPVEYSPLLQESARLMALMIKTIGFNYGISELLRTKAMREALYFYRSLNFSHEINDVLEAVPGGAWSDEFMDDWRKYQEWFYEKYGRSL